MPSKSVLICSNFGRSFGCPCQHCSITVYTFPGVPSGAGRRYPEQNSDGVTKLEIYIRDFTNLHPLSLLLGCLSCPSTECCQTKTLPRRESQNSTRHTRRCRCLKYGHAHALLNGASVYMFFLQNMFLRKIT